MVFRRKKNAKRNHTSAKIHTGPYNAGIEPVWSEKKQMRTGIKLVQKYTLVLTMLVYNHFGIQKKTNGNRNQTGAKIHAGPFNAGIEPVWYREENQMPTAIKLVLNTHWSLQCWYRTSQEFR